MSENTESSSTRESCACPSPEYYKPDVDVFENEREFVFVADLPGSSAESIDVKYENGKVEISAAVGARPIENAKQLSKEYGVANFYRSFEISEQLDAEQAQADYKDGVLTVKLPKLRATQAKKIAVTRQ